MTKMMILAGLVTLIFAVRAHADAPSPAAAGSASTTGLTTASNTMTGATLSDQQIAEIMKKANDAEISAAKTAKSHAKDAQVKDFAKHMIDEHTKNNKMAKTVEARTNIKPTSSDNSKTLARDADAQAKQLKASATFDRTYIDQQVTMHSQLLKDLDGTYIPQTQNAEMKAFLEQTRMHVQKHLQMAQQIQAKLEGTTAPKANGTTQQ